MNSYKTDGVCSTEIKFEIDDNKIIDVEFVSGCNGSLKGIGLLIKGMDVEDVIERVKGTTCKHKDTSCPDQLARALETWKLKDN